MKLNLTILTMMRTGAAADAAIAAAEDAADAAEINLNKGNTGPPPDKKPPDLSGGLHSHNYLFFRSIASLQTGWSIGILKSIAA